MQENFIFLGILIAVVVNLAIYFFIRERKEEKELKGYFKNSKRRKTVNTKTSQA